jgi:hypothetical protein
MKKLFLSLVVLIAAYSASQAQCDKNIRITASQTEYLDSTGNIQRVEPEKSTVEITGKEIVVIPGSEENMMKGKVRYIECNWKVPFKEGKMVIKTDLERNGESRATTITIEGKNGKVTFLAKADDIPNRLIRLSIDKFEER